MKWVKADLQCDTQVVGCEKMCQNAFLPVDVITFWAVQMFSVCLPTVCFMTYMVHKIKAVEDARKIKEKKGTVEINSVSITVMDRSS